MGLVCSFESLREPDDIRWLFLHLVNITKLHRKMSQFRGFPQIHLNTTPRLKIKADLEEARIEEEERLKVMDR